MTRIAETRSKEGREVTKKVASDAERRGEIGQVSRERLLWMYETLIRIRRFEERLGKEFATGKVPGWVHLYAGEEAVAVGVCSHLRDDDYIATTHRGHGHCIAKGMDTASMMAEIYGKRTGSCGGKAGSMHMADFSKGILGAIPIVGGGVALSLGPALTAKFNHTQQVSVAFFGDGSVNQGAVMESLNLAVIFRLPVVFVCENNQYAQSTPQSYSLSVDSVADRGAGFGIPSVEVDGMDVFAVYKAAGEAVDRARRGQGPTLLEAHTYRYYGHFEGEAQKYRTREEVDRYRRERDPIDGFRRSVIGGGFVSADELDRIDASMLDEIDNAVRFAEASALPEQSTTYTDVYGGMP